MSYFSEVSPRITGAEKCDKNIRTFQNAPSLFAGFFNEDKAVGRLAEIMALECGFCPDEARQIYIAATLHDIGKQKIPHRILNKFCKLTAWEFEIVKLHTRKGADMMASFQGSLGEKARQIALYHHEWWSGGGYYGKRTDELPSYIPIVAIADVYMALISERPYKHAWSQEEALAYIQNQSGSQFSPVLVNIFIPLARSDNRVAAIFNERR